jgi:hypothetical protein
MRGKGGTKAARPATVQCQHSEAILKSTMNVGYITRALVTFTDINNTGIVNSDVDNLHPTLSMVMIIPLNNKPRNF